MKSCRRVAGFVRFWEYKSPYWAGRFLDEWCIRSMRSKIEPMKKFVGTLRKHRELLLNWFKSKSLSSGIVEGFNNKVKLTVRKGYVTVYFFAEPGQFRLKTKQICFTILPISCNLTTQSQNRQGIM